MTYDQGTLEMMSSSDEHEWVKRLIGRMIEAVTEELRIPVRSLSATTWRRQDIDKGLEADECYYIRSHPKISGRKRIDLIRDPPPDLALEVVVTHGDVDKMAIYAHWASRRFGNGTTIGYRASAWAPTGVMRPVSSA